MNQTDKHVDLIKRLFEAIERRDRERFAACLHPDCEFTWPPSLPYGGTVAASAPGPGWLETWAPLQPTELERAMSPHVVAAGRNVLVVRWHQRGRNALGDAIDTPVLSCYTLEDDRLKHAEMFYFDLPAVHLFLDLSTGRHG
jgi:ketosteroid isomerase-like protein